jgi:hypothetical protein
MTGSGGWSARVVSPGGPFTSVSRSGALRVGCERDIDFVPIDNRSRDGNGDRDEIIINISTRRGGWFGFLFCNVSQKVANLKRNPCYVPSILKWTIAISRCSGSGKNVRFGV